MPENAIKTVPDKQASKNSIVLDPNRTALSDEQCELIELVRMELADYIEASLNPSDNDTEFLLFDAQTQCETISHAAELIGLDGLVACCKILVTNYEALDTTTESITPSALGSLGQWAFLLQRYLQSLLDNDNSSKQAVLDILDFMGSSKLPNPVDTVCRLTLEKLFDQSIVISEQLQSPARESIVDKDQLRLDFDEAARPELIDGLLIELPHQEQSFSAAIEQYLSERQAQHLEEAQRIAHTIKGSSNVVGVKGLAYLVHYLEDILQSFDKLQKRSEQPLINPAFDQLLIESGDCLACMVEYLLEQGSAPDNSSDILQTLINWHNYLLDHGWPDAEQAQTLNTLAIAQSDKPLTHAPTVEIKPETKTVLESNDSEKSLRVSSDIIDELLRLAGENIITNTQILSSTDDLQKSFDHIDGNHNQLRKMVDQLEQLIDIKGSLSQRRNHNSGSIEASASSTTNNYDLDELEFEEYSELHTFTHQLLELTTDTREFVAQAEQQLHELKNVAISQADINRDNHRCVLRTRMLPAQTLSARFQRCVRQTCRLTGKAARLIIHGEELLVDTHVLSALADPVMHLLRNAIDHGIEDSSEYRQFLNKPSEGIIEIEFVRDGEFINVTCRDDGKGFDKQDIERCAIANNIIGTEHALTDEQLQQLIFQPGFSTRQSVTQTSGRGVGLDVVRAAVRQLKGSISIDSQPDHGCRFTLKLPMTLLSNHAMLIRSDIGLVSIISRGVEQLLFVEHSELISSDEGYQFTYKDELISVHNLDSLLNIGKVCARPHSDFYNMLIAQRSDGKRYGILIEGVLSSRDIVVKPLNEYCFKPAGVIGATILGSGAVSPVLDLPELLDNFSTLSQKNNQQMLSPLLQVEAQHSDIRPMALVVDDSLSVRRSLAQLVEDIGMEAKTAKDGFDAIEIMAEKTPSLILVDLEMPKMNGLELTAHIRANAATRQLPVIMITSRATEKHRALAKTAGVDDYIMKPFSEDDLLASIQKHLEVPSIAS